MYGMMKGIGQDRKMTTNFETNEAMDGPLLLLPCNK